MCGRLFSAEDAAPPEDHVGVIKKDRVGRVREKQPQLPKKIEVPSDPKNLEYITLGSDTLSFQLYGILKNQTGNFCFSPISICSSLAIPYVGSSGSTQFSIGSTMHISLPPTGVQDGINRLNQYFFYYPSSASGDLRLFSANSLWVKSSLPILPDFQEIMNRDFKGALRRANFLGKGDVARYEMNNWVRERTQGQVVNMVASDDLSLNTQMVLLSSFFMRGKWEQEFNSQTTFPAPFFITKQNIKTISMMTTIGNFPFLRTESFSILQLPYSKGKVNGPNLCCLFILPKDHDGLTQLENELNGNNLQNWISRLNLQKIIVTVPKFKMDQKYNLTSTLSNLGMFESFSDQADFSSISQGKGLKLNQVIHKTLFSIEEGGSGLPSFFPSTAPVSSDFYGQADLFRADHPFIFLVYDRITKVIVFMGRFINPEDF